jgi:hypothetical protein
VPNLISTLNTADLNGQNLRSFMGVLSGASGLVQATEATGGAIYPDVDFRDHKFVITEDSTLPTIVAENANKPVVDATMRVGSLNVSLWAKFRQISRQLELTQDPSDLVQSIVDSAAALFPTAYDVKYLGDIVKGANITTVEYDAANPVASLSSALAGFDSTFYSPDAIVLTRTGVRKLGLAVDTQGRLQASGRNFIESVTGLPSFVTKATGAQLGDAGPPISTTLLAVIGPFGAGYHASALPLGVERMPQATVNAKGPEQNIVNYRIEAAMGYANGVDYDNTGRGFTILVDNA